MMFKLLLPLLAVSAQAFLPVAGPQRVAVVLRAAAREANVGRRAALATGAAAFPALAWNSAARASDADATDLIATSSGLKYRVLKEGGTGPKTQRTQKVPQALFQRR